MDGWDLWETFRENMRAERATHNIKNTTDKRKFTRRMKKTITHPKILFP